MLKKLKFLLQKLECPFCGYKSKKFLPGGCDIPVLKKEQVVGGGLRENCICPGCGSSDRERLIYCYLKNKILEKSAKIELLHVAPEQNLSLIIKNITYIKYIKADNFCDGYAYSDDVMKINIEKIPFEENRFDLIICNHVLEHVDDDKKAMKEIFRVLKPSGVAILQVPVSYKLTKTQEDPDFNTPEKRISHYGQQDHVRLYAAKDYIIRLSEAGFSVKLFSPKSKWKKFGINKAEKIFIAKKK